MTKLVSVWYHPERTARVSVKIRCVNSEVLNTLGRHTIDLDSVPRETTVDTAEILLFVPLFATSSSQVRCNESLYLFNVFLGKAEIGKNLVSGHQIQHECVE